MKLKPIRKTRHIKPILFEVFIKYIIEKKTTILSAKNHDLRIMILLSVLMPNDLSFIKTIKLTKYNDATNKKNRRVATKNEFSSGEFSMIEYLKDQK